MMKCMPVRRPGNERSPPATTTAIRPRPIRRGGGPSVRCCWLPLSAAAMSWRRSFRCTARKPWQRRWTVWWTRKRPSLMTDGLPAYKHIGKNQPHLSVNHSDREYARTDEETGLRVHVNRVEVFNGFMRRLVIGRFHSISVKHLGRYASEATFRCQSLPRPHGAAFATARAAC